MGYFLGLILLLASTLVKDEYLKDSMQTYTVMVGLGTLVSVVLFFISYFNVGALCLSCIGVYAVTFLQAAVLYFLRQGVPGDFTLKGIYNGSFYMLMATLGLVSLFQILEPIPPSSNSNFTADVPKTDAEVAALVENLKKVQGSDIKIDRSAYSGLGEDYRKGSDDAKVVIVEFADFQCGACGDASRTLKQIGNDFGNQVSIVFKNFPLDKGCNRSVGSDLHPHACDAAIAARCAGQYGKFWQMHDKLFENQRKIDESRIKLWALELGITAEQYEECKNSKDILAKVKSDIDQGLELKIQGTPAIFINGVPARERSYGALKQRIELMLR